MRIKLPNRIASGLTALIVLFSGCGKEVRLFQDKRVMMDSLVSITIYAESEPADWRQHISAAFEAMAKIESLMTTYHDSSEVSRLNAGSDTRAVRVSPQTTEVVELAQSVSKISGGAFDISIAPVLSLWNFKAESPAVPDSAAIHSRLPLVDYSDISVSNGQISFMQAGMAVDLGGIAKGYAVDAASAVLGDFGYTDFMVEAGGDLRARAGELTRGQRRIWIRHPRNRDTFFAAIRIDEGAVATSGDYERYFELDGKRYHHILDPETGYPSRSSVSVTILAETTALADAFSTAVFVLGPDKGMELIEETPGVEGVIIYLQDADIVSNLRFKASENIRDSIEIVN